MYKNIAYSLLFKYIYIYIYIYVYIYYFLLKLNRDTCKDDHFDT